jgi:hypothetical protein
MYYTSPVKRILPSLFLFSTLCALFLGAQEAKPVIRFIPFTIEGLGQEEAQFIATLIQSYVTDIGDVMYYYGVTLENPDAPQTPDFTLSGSITADQDNRVLALKLIKNETGETVYHRSIHKTTTDLTLRVRSLVETAFSTGFDGAFHEHIPQERITEAGILGTWRGDTGVEIVRLQRGGTGIAILSSGAQMNLVYRIENNTLRVTQISPNTERFYHPMPFEIARELRFRAEPWQYELFLYDGGTVLRGLKTFTVARYEGNRIVELIPGSIRNAEWTRAR